MKKSKLRAQIAIDRQILKFAAKLSDTATIIKNKTNEKYLKNLCKAKEYGWPIDWEV